MNFKKFQQAIEKQFAYMIANGNGLYVTTAGKTPGDGYRLAQDYLAAFPPGSNKQYRVNTEHHCSCCMQFIRTVGAVVTIIGNRRVSIWDIPSINEPAYEAVAYTMAQIVESAEIYSRFYHFTTEVGMDHNFEALADGGQQKWDHFHLTLPKEVKLPEKDIASTVAKGVRINAVFLRSLNEISMDAVDTTIDLILAEGEGKLYRGEEHLNKVKQFKIAKQLFDKLPPKEHSNYSWNVTPHPIRNSVIGTLLVDLSDGLNIDRAVAKFEDKMGGYKRTASIVTPGQVKKAKKVIAGKGLTESLSRKHTNLTELDVNNVLFTDKSARQVMLGLDEIMSNVETSTKSTKKDFDNVQEVTIDQFMMNLLPKAISIELYFENRHTGNLMNLVSPMDASAPPLTQWSNGITWDYNGGSADSMKQHVKAAGGITDALVRFSILWNRSGNNNIDFDAHAKGMNEHIYYQTAGQTHQSSGKLDIDITQPNGKIAVENIIYTDLQKMKPGKYSFGVENYSTATSNEGFEAEIEFNGELYEYKYPKSLRGKEFIMCGTLILDSNGKFTIEHHLPHAESKKTMWGLNPGEFHKIDLVTLSPNFWEGEPCTGNKHIFFIINSCLNDAQPRGFFNEFLRKDLNEVRKVFDKLGSVMRVPESDDQVAGLGFSSTQKNDVICRVKTDERTQMVKIQF